MEQRPLSPLWPLFSTFKDQSTALLSIEEYFFLVKALYQLPIEEIASTEEELLKFCKLFWLKNESENSLFERCFRATFNSNLLKIVREEIVDETQKEQAESTEKSNNKEENNSINTGDQPLAEKEKKKTKKKKKESAGTGNQMIDFELMIGDVEGDARSAKQEIYINHNFNLWDQTIMPFDLRYFAQRLRRRVETASYETTEYLDVPEMIASFGRNGYMHELIFEKRIASNSNVVLLADRHGSMLSYEYWEKQLTFAFKAIPSCNFEHFSFYNLPRKKTEGDHYVMDDAQKTGVLFDSEKGKWNGNTWFFIFSDAGAHSGMVNGSRIEESIDFWYYLEGISKNVFWLNPVPKEYQNDCTSRRLNYSIPMIYPDKDGLNAITKRKSHE